MSTLLHSYHDLNSGNSKCCVKNRWSWSSDRSSCYSKFVREGCSDFGQESGFGMLDFYVHTYDILYDSHSCHIDLLRCLLYLNQPGTWIWEWKTCFTIVCIIYDALVWLSDKVGSLKCSEVFYQNQPFVQRPFLTIYLNQRILASREDKNAYNCGDHCCCMFGCEYDSEKDACTSCILVLMRQRFALFVAWQGSF